jgi:3,5-epimerase/4-reductase
LHDLLPASLLMADNHVTGIYNFTNPGAISHNEVLTLYKKHIDPKFQWKNFSLEEQAKVIKADRSNCELDSAKLTNKLKFMLPTSCAFKEWPRTWELFPLESYD